MLNHVMSEVQPMLGESEYNIKFRYKSELDTDWHFILTFVYGPAYRKNDKVVYLKDVSKFLPEENVENANWDEVYDKLQPFITEQKKKWGVISFDFSKTSLPILNKEYPKI